MQGLTRRLEVRDDQVVEILEIRATDVDTGNEVTISREERPTQLTPEVYKEKLEGEKKVVEDNLKVIDEALKVAKKISDNEPVA